MPITRRTLLTGAAAAAGIVGASGAASLAIPSLASGADAAAGSLTGGATIKKRLTGVDRPTHERWQVGGTDLGIPYLLANNSVGFLCGDTFNTRWDNDPPLPNDWRSPVILRSNSRPGDPDGIVFDSAAGVQGDGRAPEVVTHNGHNGDDGAGTREVTVIPNDAVTLPDGRHVMSYMSIGEWINGNPAVNWRSNYAGLAVSPDGNMFERQPTVWRNEGVGNNGSPFQMVTMQLDGEFVYVYSVMAGRQQGPMMLRRVRHQSILDQGAYESWNGSGWGKEPKPIMEGRFGEPSVRKLSDGAWVMSYLDVASGAIVTRKSDGPDKKWSEPKSQVTQAQQVAIYGGFIHPYSTSKANDLHLLVSRWPRTGDQSHAYDISQWIGSV